MKRWKKIVLAVLAVVILSTAALAAWQWNNLRAVYDFLTLDSGQIAENLERRREEHQAALQAKVKLRITPPTSQQSDALLEGAVTPEQVKEELGITEELSGETQGEWTEEELINRCVAELYGCKVDIMDTLGKLKQETLDVWLNLTDEERTSTRMKEVGFDGLEKCYALEKVVDDQVRKILARYREELKEIGGDLSILDTLWNYYSDEKAAEKAYYLDKYLN